MESSQICRKIIVINGALEFDEAGDPIEDINNIIDELKTRHETPHYRSGPADPKDIEYLEKVKEIMLRPDYERHMLIETLL